MLRDSILQQDRTVATLSGELGERNREIEFLRERLSAVERDNKDIAERVALDHERMLREKQSDIDALRDRARDGEARMEIMRDEMRALEDKCIHGSSVAEQERR